MRRLCFAPAPPPPVAAIEFPIPGIETPKGGIGGRKGGGWKEEKSCFQAFNARPERKVFSYQAFNARPEGDVECIQAFKARPEGATSSQPRASERSERHPGFGQDANDTPPEGAKAATGAFKSANADVQIRQCGRLNRRCGWLNRQCGRLNRRCGWLNPPMRTVKSAAAGIQFHRRGHSNPQ